MPEQEGLVCGLGEFLLPLVMGKQRISELPELMESRNIDVKPSAVFVHPKDGADGHAICSRFRAC